MRVRAPRTLKQFWKIPPRAELPLRSWYAAASRELCTTPQDVKNVYGAPVDFAGDNRIIFDIGGNTYRLIFHVPDLYKRVLIKFVGTHGEYDKIGAETV